MTAINRFIREIEVVDLIDITDPETIQKEIDSCKGKEKSEASKYPMPEIDEDRWRKYEILIQQRMVSKIKKG